MKSFTLSGGRRPESKGARTACSGPLRLRPSGSAQRERISLVLLSLLCSCTWKVDPDKGRFSCTTDADCGGGYKCIAQFSGGGLCFKDGACTAEQCNGKDDNCDGRTDESFPEDGMACSTGLQGACAAGKSFCSDAGVLSCRGTYQPVTEVCNGIDDDCMNGVDDGFNFATDPLNCGTCGNVCGTGAACMSSACHEVNCADGIDNDDGGDPDCLDPDCLAMGCGLDGGFDCGAKLVPVDAGTPDAGDVDAGTDDGGVSDAGMDDGGTDAGQPDAGPFDAGYVTVLACVPRETTCNDGIDQDLDGRLDCADSDCDGKACDGGTCMNGMCQ